MIEFESITDRPSCHIDQASKETDRTTALAIAQIRTELHADAQSLSECDQCGCDIPKARQEAQKGCKQCFDCAHLIWIRSRGVRRV